MAVDIIARGIAAGRVPITAYDMAVAGGYVGTKEEFEADMGNSGTNATNAANSAAAAAASAAEASALADDIAQYKTDTMTAPANITEGEYILAAGTLYRATANIASGSTLTPNGNVVAVTVGEELTKVIASDAQKADADGTSPNLTAGNALQLVSTVGIEDQVPYNFRTSGGTADIGDREEDMVVGGTITWNQLVNDGNFVIKTGWASGSASLTIEDGIATVQNTSSTYCSLQKTNSQKVNILSGHKVLIQVDLNVSTGKGLILPDGTSAGGYKAYAIPESEWTNVSLIYIPGIDISANFTIRFSAKTQGTSELIVGKVKNYCAFDLTQMFGTTIADYIYSLEQANAGDGVAWFRKLFPKEYYAYGTGTLQSVQTSAHKMVGFNAFDKSTAVIGKRIQLDGSESSSSVMSHSTLIPVIPGAKYFAKWTGTANVYGIVYFGAAKQPLNKGGFAGALQNKVVTIPNDAYFVYLNVSLDQLDVACFNLSWDGEKDGTYEPYVEYNYPLDDSLTLRGVPTLDENNKLRYDGDTYESDGTVTRKWGIIDLGTRTFTYQETTVNPGQYVFTFTLPSDAKAADGSASTKIIICPIYTTYYSTGYSSYNMSIYRGYTRSVYIRNDGYTDAATFKAAMSGVYVLYELATPTTETAEAYTNPQFVDDFGTEEYVDAGVEASTRDVAIPVGHETFYRANLRAKLEMSPDSPDGDGDYIVRQANGENTYVPLVIPNELPAQPSEDGTYHLQVVVTGGVPTVSWVADT